MVTEMDNSPRAKAKCNIYLECDEQGKWVYPASKRSDGSWRKPIPTRPGYLEAQQLYVCKGRRDANALAEQLANTSIITTENGQVDPLVEINSTEMTQEESGVKGGKPPSTDTTDGENETCSKPKSKVFSIPKMEDFWSHLVPAEKTYPERPKTATENTSPKPPQGAAEKSYPEPQKDGKSKTSEPSINTGKEKIEEIFPHSKVILPAVEPEKKPEIQLPKIETLSLDQVDCGKTKQTLSATTAALLDLEEKADFEYFLWGMKSGKISSTHLASCWNSFARKWNLIKYSDMNHFNETDKLSLARTMKIFLK